MADGAADERMSLADHLRQLGRRIRISLLWLAGGVALAFVLREEILFWLTAPLTPVLGRDPKLHFSSPVEPFFTYMRLSFQAGLLFAAPAILYNLWAFVAPGLHRPERRFVLRVTFWAIALFFAGAAFAYFVVLPYGFAFLLNFAQLSTPASEWLVRLQENLRHLYGPAIQLPISGELALEPTIMMDGYLTLVLNLMLVFGVVFEFPLVLYHLAVSRLVQIRTFMNFFRYFVVIAFIVAAILTPPDVATQVMMAIPMLVMYLASVGLAAVVLHFRKP